jgi:lactoylglutathione lyase
MDLTLLVIRSAIPEQLAEFYTLLGMTFEYHRHGNGPYHYSVHIGRTLLEIYPLAKGQEKADSALRLGFAIAPFSTVVEELVRRQVPFHQAPTTTEWGVMAIIADPEGRKIELYQK